MTQRHRCSSCKAEVGQLHEPYCSSLVGVPVGATFAELGIPFPLYEDDIEATEFCGLATCMICQQSARPCFNVDAIVVACSACGADNALYAQGPAASPCPSCKESMERPPLRSPLRQYRVCYVCLRAGRAILTKSTEYGLISWDESRDGLTAGIPFYGLDREGLDLVPMEADGAESDDADEFVRVRLPRESMLELLRTPTYSTWQGENWLFCCRHPMVFVGNWHEEKVAAIAPDGNTERFFNEMMKANDLEVADLWESAVAGNISVYLFRCPTCGRYRGHWDCD